MDYIKAGVITHYFNNIGVAVLDVTEKSLKVGDTIRIGEFAEGFEQKIESMQVEHQNVDEAKVGDEVGLKVLRLVSEKDVVYKAID